MADETDKATRPANVLTDLDPQADPKGGKKTEAEGEVKLNEVQRAAAAGIFGLGIVVVDPRTGVS